MQKKTRKSTLPESELLQDVGAQIRSCRKLAGLSIADVSALLYLKDNSPNIYRIEAGQRNISLKILHKLASAVNAEIHISLIPVSSEES